MFDLEKTRNFYSPDDLPAPRTRKEFSLAKLAGADVSIPDPRTRTEHYMKAIAEKNDPLVVTLTQGSSTPYVTDKTGGEIFDAVEAGREVILDATALMSNSGKAIMPCAGKIRFPAEVDDPEHWILQFSGIVVGNPSGIIMINITAFKGSTSAASALYANFVLTPAD